MPRHPRRTAAARAGSQAGVRQLPVAPPGQPVPAARDPVRRPGRGDPRGLAADPLRDRHRGPRRPGARRVRGARARPSIRETRRVRLDPPRSRRWSPRRRASSRSTRATRSATSCSAARTSCSARSAGRRSSRDLDRGRRPGNFADFLDYVRAHRGPRHRPPGGRRPARAQRPAGRDPPPRHVPDVRDDARQDLAVPGLRRDRRSTTRSRSPRSSAASTASALVARAVA